MHVLVTGASGTIGSAATRALLRQGHTVTATVTAQRPSQVPEGAQVFTADLFDPAALSGVAGEIDGAVHAASSNDERAAELDQATMGTLIEAFAGTGKPLVYTSGLWLHGNSGDTPITEESPINPPTVVSWRPAIEQAAASAAARGVRSVRIRPGLVYGGGRGYVPMLLSPQEVDGRPVVCHFGDGSNRWAAVHADDLGDLYALAVVDAPAGSVYLGTAGDAVQVRDAAKIVADKHGAQVQHWDPAAAQQYWGVMVEALMLDQVATNAKARTELGWAPHRPGLLDELAATGA